MGSDHLHTNHLTNQDPGFFTLWNPEYMLLTILLAYLYLRAVGTGRERFANSSPVSSLQKISFLTGLALFYTAVGSPINYYGHHVLFSAHMFQQSILFMTVPPLLLLGTPAWLLRPLLNKAAIAKAVSIASHPILAVTTFNVLFSFYHLPFIFDAIMEYQALHFVYHVILFVTAVQMWWLITCPVPEWNRLTHLKKMGYIFANGVLLTPACALIIFADNSLYTTFANAPQVIYWLPSLDDQQLGGVLMKLIQEFAYGTGLWYVFTQWYRKENPADKIDQIDPMEATDEGFALSIQPEPSKQS